jgi:hypothetical protein
LSRSGIDNPASLAALALAAQQTKPISGKTSASFPPQHQVSGNGGVHQFFFGLPPARIAKSKYILL